MIKIDYPEYRPRIKTVSEKEWIFDTFRRQWVVLTPEEWVRQNFLQYITLIKKYPESLIAIEKEIQLGEISKRFDIVVYNRDTRPWMIVECKEMNESLNEKALSQALRYNIILQVPFIVITNGSFCYGFECKAGNLEEINQLPDYTNGSG